MADNICYKCGSILPPGSERCPNCGAPAPLTDAEISRPARIRPATIVPPREAPSSGASSSATRPLARPAPQAAPAPESGSRTRVLDPTAAAAATPQPVRPEVSTLPPQRHASAPQAPAPQAPAPQAPARPAPGRPSAKAGRPQQTAPSRGKSVILIVGILALVIGAVFAGYSFFAAGSDDNAERNYAITDVPLRSSKLEIGAGNAVGTVPYGGSLVTYEKDGQWARVKYEPADGSRALEGYMPEWALLNRVDLFRLQSIFGTPDAAVAVAEPHQRRALVNYFTAHGLVGRTTDEGIAAGLPEPNGDNQWQLRVRNAQAPMREVFFGNIFDPESDYADMAVILHPLNGGDNKLIYYTFDNDGTPVFRFEREVGSHNLISSVTASDTAPDGIEIEFVY